MRTDNAPFLRQPASITRVMLQVLLALLPAIALYVWQFGPAILVQLALASVAALSAEAAMLALRRRPIGLHLGDLSALVTAWLIALAFPPVAPAWLTFAACAFAIVVVKQLYGGLGQNPFNPAMAAYCAMIVAFPALMARWPGAGEIDFATQLGVIFGTAAPDAVSSATPLDALRTGLRGAGTRVATLREGGGFGWAGGRGWEWVALGLAAGGLWLLARRIITWHIPTAFLATLALAAGLAWLIDPARHAPPLFHLASCGAMLGAFFILTDPVSGATTPRGKLLFGAGAGLLTWVIRTWGAYPDGVAFATLLMNLCVPLIDLRTQPPVFGHKQPQREPRR